MASAERPESTSMQDVQVPSLESGEVKAADPNLVAELNWVIQWIGVECDDPREIQKARDLLRRARDEIARLSETWFDADTQETWRPPTAWAYAQVCKKMHALERGLAEAEEDSNENSRAAARAVEHAERVDKQLAEARRDAERYRWLREHHWKPRSRNVEIDAGYHCTFMAGTFLPSAGMDMDEAVDFFSNAARAQSKEGK